MSYTTIHQCANDPEFINRLMAACADEGDPNPDFTASTVRWPVSSADDIATAYEFAVNSDNPSPGGDPTVITDQMILSAVQPLLNPPPAEEP